MRDPITANVVIPVLVTGTHSTAISHIEAIEGCGGSQPGVKPTPHLLIR